MAPRLWPIGEHDVSGGHDPATWRYRCTVEGPSRRLVRTLTADETIHIRLGSSAASPWLGVSPMLAAADTTGTLAGVEAGIRKEASGTSGYVVPAQSEGLDDQSFAQLKADLAAIEGQTRIVPTMNPRPATLRRGLVMQIGERSGWE